MNENDYVRAVLDAYRRTPTTTGRVHRQDRLLAVELYRRGIPLAVVENALSLETLWAKMDKEVFPLFARLDSEPFGDELLAREETRELVNATMSQLPPHYREALEAKYVDGSSVRDLASRLHVSEKAVESQLTRARKAFRATFLALARNLGAELC